MNLSSDLSVVGAGPDVSFHCLPFHVQYFNVIHTALAVTLYIMVTRQLPKVFSCLIFFCKVELYIADILYITVTLSFPKGDRFTQV